MAAAAWRTATDPASSKVYQTTYDAYDAKGRLTQSTQTIAGSTYTFTYANNVAGQVEKLHYPSGREVRTCYDSVARGQSVSRASTGVAYATVNDYAAHGGIRSLTLGNSLVESTKYDYDSNQQKELNTRGQESQIVVGNAVGNLLQLNNYYCPNGAGSCSTNTGNVARQETRVPAVAGFVITQNYTYDALDRLLTAVEADRDTTNRGWEQDNGFDAWGNRWLASFNGLPSPANDVPRTSNWFTGANSSSIPSNQMAGMSYDRLGNLTRSGLRALTYDGESRLQQSLPDLGSATKYIYDGLGHRVQKVTPSGTTSYVYTGDGLLAAEYTTEAVADVGTQYLTADALGSTRLVTDPSGAAIKRYDYLPTGEEIPTDRNGRASVAGYTATSGITVKFTGKERDAETGLDYFGARYMSSAQGRFTSPDAPFADQHPANPQSWNLYSYTLNNPLRYVDPNGRGVLEGLKRGIDSIGIGMISLATQPDRVAAGAWRAVSHPVRTAEGIGASLKSFWHSSLDEKVTSVVSFALPAVLGGGAGALGAGGGAGTATTLGAISEGSGAATTETATTSLFRAVGSTEAESIGSTGVFSAAPGGTEFKGFFFSEADAQSFGGRMTEMTGDPHTVVPGEAPTSLVQSSPPHSAATEGRGVLIKNENLPQVKVKPPNE